jgi:hypothetical protein
MSAKLANGATLHNRARLSAYSQFNALNGYKVKQIDAATGL